MKKLLIGSVFFSAICSAALVFAAPSSKSNHFIVEFETGDSYDTVIKDNTITWKGLAGEDKDMVEEAPVKHIAFSKNVDIYQWNEKRGSFVTFIVNKKNNTAVTSTKASKNKDWLTTGKIKYLD